LELRDFIVTPVILFIVYAVAYMVRPHVTDEVSRKYFFPALTVRIVGAIAVGLIYQFYYSGGDTFNYHTHGSRHIWEAFMKSPADGFALLTSNGEYKPGIWKTAEKIWFWRDPSSFFVIKVATIFDLFTFSTYSATAVLFAVFSFTGAWMFFKTFYRKYPTLHAWIAFSVLFIPTVVFWGSGIFKDSITLACLGIGCHAFDVIFIRYRLKVSSILLLLFTFWMIFSIKKYILLIFLPALLVWGFAQNVWFIRSAVVRILITPVVGVTVLLLIYFAVPLVSQDDVRYNISSISQTAKVTAYDIRYGWGARTGEGSGYTLGELDGSWESMLRLAPNAINVSLFRPYIWEIKNSLMLLSGIEALMIFCCTLFVLFRIRMKIFRLSLKPDILFCLVFSLTFAFAVGISTYNFGTLSRYKIPMIPYFMLALGLLHHYWKSERKVVKLEPIEYA
jgi:hypothetical protein